MQQAVLMYTTRTQALELLVSELQDDAKDLLPSFYVLVENRGVPCLCLVIFQSGKEQVEFSTLCTGWYSDHVDPTTWRLLFSAQMWALVLHKFSSDGVMLSVAPSSFTLRCSRHTLPLVLERLQALNRPELPADSRAALAQFLHTAAHIFD